MTLKFYAKEDLLVVRPYVTLYVGGPGQYVGRKLKNGEYVVKDSPDEFDANSKEGKRIIKLVKRDNSLICADEYTAKTCGVQYIKHVFADGAWIPQQ
jgi:hypothetical protein